MICARCIIPMARSLVDPGQVIYTCSQCGIQKTITYTLSANTSTAWLTTAAPAARETVPQAFHKAFEDGEVLEP